MEISGVGAFTKDDKYGDYISEPVRHELFDNDMTITVECYEDDDKPEEIHAAIENFMAIERSVLEDAQPFIFAYYEAVNDNWEPDDEEYIQIDSPGDIWKHIQFGKKTYVSRRPRGDRGIYVVVECECSWEPEHGLMLVFRNGEHINKVGQFDGHLTNSDSYDLPDSKDFVYR